MQTFHINVPNSYFGPTGDSSLFSLCPAKSSLLREGWDVEQSGTAYIWCWTSLWCISDPVLRRGTLDHNLLSPELASWIAGPPRGIWGANFLLCPFPKGEERGWNRAGEGSNGGRWNRGRRRSEMGAGGGLPQEMSLEPRSTRLPHAEHRTTYPVDLTFQSTSYRTGTGLRWSTEVFWRFVHAFPLYPLKPQ